MIDQTPDLGTAYHTARKDGAIDLDAVKRAVASVPDSIHEQAR